MRCWEVLRAAQKAVCCDVADGTHRHIALSLITSRQIALLHHYATAPKSKDGQLELLQSWLLSDLVSQCALNFLAAHNKFGGDSR